MELDLLRARRLAALEGEPEPLPAEPSLTNQIKLQAPILPDSSPFYPNHADGPKIKSISDLHSSSHCKGPPRGGSNTSTKTIQLWCKVPLPENGIPITTEQFINYVYVQFGHNIHVGYHHVDKRFLFIDVESEEMGQELKECLHDADVPRCVDTVVCRDCKDATDNH